MATVCFSVIKLCCLWKASWLAKAGIDPNKHTEPQLLYSVHLHWKEPVLLPRCDEPRGECELCPSRPCQWELSFLRHCSISCVQRCKIYPCVWLSAVTWRCMKEWFALSSTLILLWQMRWMFIVAFRPLRSNKHSTYCMHNNVYNLGIWTTQYLGMFVWFKKQASSLLKIIQHSNGGKEFSVG